MVSQMTRRARWGRQGTVNAATLWDRDARVNRLYEGTTQIQKLIIARFATGIDAIG